MSNHVDQMNLFRTNEPNRKGGFTLMELMVYIAILGIVVLIAGQAFSDSTKIRVRTQSQLRSTEVAENVGSLLNDDIAQMGAKSAKEEAAGASFDWTDSVYIDIGAEDSSSFKVGANGDSLKFRRIRYSDKGAFDAVEEVVWYKQGKSLFRSCISKVQNAGATASADCPSTGALVVEMATEVDSFRVIPATPGVLSSDYASTSGSTRQFPRLLPSSTDTSIHDFRFISRFGDNDFTYLSSNPEEGGTSVAVSGFASNYNFDDEEIDTDGKKANQVFVASAGDNGADWRECQKVNLKVGYTYEISFEIPFVENNSRMFCPGRDHIAVGFRNGENGNEIPGLEDFLFYPPATINAGGKRSFRFSVRESVNNACMAFTFVTYSPLANSGAVSISNLELNRVESSNYTFDESRVNYSTMSVLDKRNVKAFKINLQIKTNGEAGKVSLVIPTPSNGVKD